MRIFVRILLAIALVFLLWQLCLKFTIGNLQATQQRQQRAQLSDLDRQLNQFSFIPKLLAEDVEIRAAVLNPGDATALSANKRLANTREDSGLDVAFLMDKTGLTVASSNWSDPVSFVGVSYSFRPYFKNASLGNSSTFFAVGATTGIPGYFIAEPIVADAVVQGVIVAKVSLDVLIENWLELPYDSVVLDEFGGVILSSREDLLYRPTRQFTPEQIAQLDSERRYQLRESAITVNSDGGVSKAVIKGVANDEYFLFRQPLQTEPWQLLSLIHQGAVERRALLMTAALAAAFLIVLLLARLYQQQRRLVQSEQRHSLELEDKVRERTVALENAQQRLISESNFAMLGRLSGAINHEINQPLASLRLNLASLRKMIEKKNADPVEIEQIVVDSDRTTKRIGRVISSLRSVAQKNESRFERVDVNDIVLDVQKTVSRERPSVSQCLRIETTNDSPSFYVQGDDILIQQALLNLLYNAFDAVLSESNPVVSLSLSSELPAANDRADDESGGSLGSVYVSVKDNGVGVSPSVAENLFEPFLTTRQRSDGLGLGLTIARQIAADHGGRLGFSQQDKGSHFWLSLPLVDTSS